MRQLFIVLTSLTLAACPADQPDPSGDAGNDDTNHRSDVPPASQLSLLDIDPADGPVAGGTTVTLHGTGFVAPMTARFGGSAQVETTVISPTEATVVTPAAPARGTVTVVVSTNDNTAALLSSFTYTGEPPLVIERCHLQFPHVIEDATPGAPITFYGRVKVDGVTGMQQPHPRLYGQLFYGPLDDPTATAAVDATLSADPIALGDGEDEYEATVIPMEEGMYVFGFRFTGDDDPEERTWSYCTLLHDSTELHVHALGSLMVGDVDTIDFCHIWQDTLEDDADPTTQPLVTVEVYEDPTTVDNGGANSDALEVQAAALPPGANPALASLFDVTWNPLPYKALRDGSPNNYEYEGTPYTEATHPPAGSYNVVARVRHTDGAWTYCDIDETADEFRLEAASALTIQ